MKVLIGSKNKAKIEGAKAAFLKFFDNVEIEGIDVDSMVSEQPVDRETYEGAVNRVQNVINYANLNGVKADYYIAIESGLIELYGNYFIISIAVIKDNKNKSSVGLSPAFPVPLKYVDQIKKECFGNVMDNLFNGDNSHVGKGGINFLTNGKVTRGELTTSAFIMALTQFVNEKWS